MRWTKPRMIEVKMDAEIGSYQEDGDDRSPPAARHFRQPLRARSPEPLRRAVTADFLSPS